MGAAFKFLDVIFRAKIELWENCTRQKLGRHHRNFLGIWRRADENISPVWTNGSGFS